MVERQCPYCERIFQPSKYQPGQSVCSDAGCQRRRRADYHRQKIAADPEYRQVCLDSPQKWRSRNPDYWRRYREQHPAAVGRNRQQQHVRDQKQRLRDLANNNSAFDLKRSAAEIWLLGHGLQNLANNTMDAWSVSFRAFSLSPASTAFFQKPATWPRVGKRLRLHTALLWQMRERFPSRPGMRASFCVCRADRPPAVCRTVVNECAPSDC
jgi:hypothetical protein